MKGYGDEMEAARHPLDDDEMVEYMHLDPTRP
jgi:hypothetical protein